MADPGSGRDESERERLDRNLSELLQELRVALPGVQVLFAFLLTIPFAQRFSQLTTAQERIYLGILLATTISAALLIAPSAYHRINFRKQQKGQLVFMSNLLAIVGLGFLALAMTGAILLVTDYIFGTAATVITAATAAAVFLVLWYALPLRRRMTSEEQ
jgi:Family of unknown function (DUF6328)